MTAITTETRNRRDSLSSQIYAIAGLVGLVLGIGGCIPAHAQTPITIEEAVSLALQNNKGLKTIERQIGIQQGVVAENRTRFNPTLTANGTATYYDRGQSGNIGGQTITFFERTQREGKVAASLPIDVAGMIRASVKQADLSTLSARFAYDAAKNNLTAQVRSAYLEVLRRKALVTVAEDNRANARERLRVVEVERRAGKSAEFELLRVQADVTSAEEAVLRAENNVALAIAQLKRTLGMPSDAAFVLPDAAATESGTPKLPETEEPLFAEAKEKRPEVRQAQVETRAAELGITLARRDSVPTVGISAGYSNTPDSAGLSPLTELSNVSVSVRIPLYDGGLRRAREKQARARVESASANREDTQDSVTLEVRQAYLNLQTANRRIPVAEATITAAQESYRIAVVRLKAGVGTLVETTDAQAALTRAQTDLVNARYDLRDAENALNRALGRY
jgi:outer membrane protein